MIANSRKSQLHKIMGSKQNTENKSTVYFRSSLMCLLALIGPSQEHARLLEPPSRASAWRLGFPTPVDQDDNQSYCGGFGIQHGVHGGKCGICGDSWEDFPRAHEAPGGIYATGIITKTYNQGSLIPVVIDLTANHQGYFEFKLCPNNNIFIDQDQHCFDSIPSLWISGGDPSHHNTRYSIHDYETGFRLLYVKLPLNVTCEQCIFQWTYVAGNNWGKCDNGSTGVGCGPQESFRSCADIQIVPHPLMADNLGNEPNIDPDYEDFQHIILENDAEYENEYVLQSNQDVIQKKALLERVLKRLRELIIQSQQTQSMSREPAYQSLAQTSKKEPPIVPISDHDEDEAMRVKLWSDRILSNRH